VAVPVTDRLPAPVLAVLRCPHRDAPLHLDGRTLRCPDGHAFDVARQGHVDLRGPAGARRRGDDLTMVQRRQRVQAAGLHEPLLDRLAATAARVLRDGPPGLVVDVGAGPGLHLARVLDDHVDRFGLAIDVSRHAAQRAALAHPRAGAVVADVWEGLPIRDGAAALLLDVFAPRDPDGFHRLLHPDGDLLVVTPLPQHLAALVAALDLPRVDPAKEERLERGIGRRFQLADREELRWVRPVDRAGAIDLAAMGPAGHHLDPDELHRRAAALPPTLELEWAVELRRYRPRGGPAALEQERDT
jgi:SAM-dependent methyltransferase